MQIIFVSATKINEITTSILICYSSKHIYTLAHQGNHLYEKRKFISHKQYSFGLVFSENPRKSHIDQVYYKFFYSFKKETTPKLLKEATAKNVFSSVYVVVTSCFEKCFLFHVITGRHCFL